MKTKRELLTEDINQVIEREIWKERRNLKRKELRLLANIGQLKIKSIAHHRRAIK